MWTASRKSALPQQNPRPHVKVHCLNNTLITDNHYQALCTFNAGHTGHVLQIVQAYRPLPLEH